MIIADHDELPVCLNNNSDALISETAKEVGVVRVRSLDDILHYSDTSLLSTVQVLVPPSGASHLTGSSCAERARGISPRPMQADVSPFYIQPENSWYPDIQAFNIHQVRDLQDSPTVNRCKVSFASRAIAQYGNKTQSASQIFEGTEKESKEALPNLRSHAERVTPGFGEAYPKCGEVRFVVVCPDNPKHHKRLMHHTCDRAACPECWPSWASRAAKDASQRIEGYREATGTSFLSRHITMHPPEGLIVGDGPAALQQLFDEGRKVAGIAGMKAAAVIAHHDRLNPDVKARCEAAAIDTGQNRYEWALSQENWHELVRYSPHLHMEVYGPLMNSDDFFELTGWTYRNHDDGAGSGREGEDLKQTLYYLLTHAWVKDNKKVVRYWLGLSTHSLKCTDVGFREETEPCPVCQCDCVKIPPDVTWMDGTVHAFFQDLHNAPVHVVKIRLYCYEVRSSARRRGKRISAKASAVWGPAGPPVPS